MSVQTLYTAATGMEALETKLDVIANNLANVSTVGFKKDRANFEDLFYRHNVVPGAEQTNPTGEGISVGLGTRVSSVQSSLLQGPIQLTNNPLDLAIEGDGYFEVQDAEGNSFYTRAGNFHLNADGTIVLGSANVGRALQPAITISNEVTDIRITADGQVQTRIQGQADFQTAGTIQVSSFPNPGGLLKVGDNLYVESPASGNASQATPGQQGLGILRQGTLEASNVEPVQELIDLIQTQRNFELNSQAIQAGDEIMQLVSNLRR